MLARVNLVFYQACESLKADWVVLVKCKGIYEDHDIWSRVCNIITCENLCKYCMHVMKTTCDAKFDVWSEVFKEPQRKD